MNLISDFEVVESLGRQKVRKFNEVVLVKNRQTGILGVQKTFGIHSKNEHLIPLIKQESELNFNFTGLPHTLAFEERETELILIRSYLPGIPLDEYWRKLPKAKRFEFLKVFFQKLSLIFSELNRLSIVHGDIKPTNILVTEEWECSLIDFGMAVQKENIFSRKTLFALGYAAPELILNELDLVNTSTDIFALGITIWQLFTGELPLRHANPGIMTNLQITYPMPIDRRVPKVWMEIIQKMCFKHPFRMPPSQLEKEEVRLSLKTAMTQRYQNLEEISQEISLYKSERKWFNFWKTGGL
ncbi:MAG: protein kinase [Crocinitomicaceae bacterium]|nr:protein kinase [Crocinitomicaceae bacterium]